MSAYYDFGQFEVIAPLCISLARLRGALLDTDIVFVLPDSVLPGVTSVYGIDVIRAAVPVPLLAHTGARSEEPR